MTEPIQDPFVSLNIDAEEAMRVGEMMTKDLREMRDSIARIETAVTEILRRIR